MDIKSAERFMEKLVKAGKEYGFEECEAAYASESSMSIDILDGEVSSYESSATSTLSFRGLKNGQMGFFYRLPFKVYNGELRSIK